MNNPIAYQMYHMFLIAAFRCSLQFPRRWPQSGKFDNGIGELSDAASALDWLQALTSDARQCWIAGYSSVPGLACSFDAQAGNFRLHLRRAAGKSL